MIHQTLTRSMMLRLMAVEMCERSLELCEEAEALRDQAREQTLVTQLGAALAARRSEAEAPPHASPPAFRSALRWTGE